MKNSTKAFTKISRRNGRKCIARMLTLSLLRSSKKRQDWYELILSILAQSEKSAVDQEF